MTWQIHRLVVPVRFPAGLAPGERRDANALLLATDGAGVPTLRGSSIAGALRHAYAASAAADEVAHWFGSALGDGRHDGSPSRLIVHDLRFPGVNATVRTHNAIDRHHGAPLDGAIFSIGSLPPGVRGTLVFVVRATADEVGGAKAFLESLVELLGAGLTFGGNAARGIGTVMVAGANSYRHFDLADRGAHGDWLDEQVDIATGTIPQRGVPLVPASRSSRLRVTFKLRVPRGQDVLFGGGEGCDFAVEPQRVRAADGAEQLRMPGSAMRGVFRSWVTRLACREGKPVVDTSGRACERQVTRTPLNGADIGWGCAGQDGSKEQVTAAEGCPILRLFGSLRSKGRIHIADALIPLNQGWLQARKHVSVDRISGGATEGFLFDSQVVCLPEHNSIQFEMTVDEPTDDEARWLAATLKAIDLGVLRVGSSKSSGRLALAESPIAKGPHERQFNDIKPFEVSRA